MSFKEDLGIILERTAKKTANDLCEGLAFDFVDEVTTSMTLEDEFDNEYELSITLKEV